MWTRLDNRKKLIYNWAPPGPRARIMEMAMNAKSRYQRNYHLLGLATALPPLRAKSNCTVGYLSYVAEVFP